MQNNVYFTLIFILTLLIEPCFAQESQEKAYVKNSSQLIARSPGGSKMGELYINSPVKVLDEKNGWTKVSVETWIRSNSLKKAIKKKSAKGVSKAQVVISSYTTKLVSDGLPTKRLYVQLKLKNTTKEDISSWNALLVAQDGGKVLFREPIADDTKKIKAGSVIDISFYWEEGEKVYQILYGAKPSDVKLGLYKFKIR